MTLVLDASAAIGFSLRDDFSPVIREELVAPHLMWSEVASALREQVWRGELTRSAAVDALASLEGAPIEVRAPRRLRRIAFELAEQLGWARTYDAEYLALAQILGCRMLTLDEKLWRGAGRLGLVVRPQDI